MREIKFRAWDEDRKYMITSDLDHIDFEKNIAYWYDVTADIEPDGSQGEPYQIQAASYDIVPLQYTGLKDKNGVEIYEGDIYITPFEEKVGKKLGIQIDSKAQVVTWNRCGFSPLENEEYITVIGNIYENPELLK